jgi:predicted ATPase
MITQTAVLRRPTFSLKKVINPVIKFFVRIADAFIEARQLQAATETAIYLKSHNKDFKDMSHSEIVYMIMNDIKKEGE